MPKQKHLYHMNFVISCFLKQRLHLETRQYFFKTSVLQNGAAHYTQENMVLQQHNLSTVFAQKAISNRYSDLLYSIVVNIQIKTSKDIPCLKDIPNNTGLLVTSLTWVVEVFHDTWWISSEVHWLPPSPWRNHTGQMTTRTWCTRRIWLVCPSVKHTTMPGMNRTAYWWTRFCMINYNIIQ